jgi:tRNA (cytidine56-2'-O)-methyltransferase
MIVVLRLGHRLKRDERISTHCGLVSRALGADKIIYTGERDEQIIESIKKITKKWGSGFKSEYQSNWRTVIKSHRKKGFFIVHLTMYGLPYEKKIRKLKQKKNLLVIIGSEKVPWDVYEMADINLAVTNQPHSEVAALAVVLEKLGRKKPFIKAKIEINPSARGKFFRKK